MSLTSGNKTRNMYNLSDNKAALIFLAKNHKLPSREVTFYIKQFVSKLTFEIINSISRAKFLFLLDLKEILFTTKAFNLESLQTEGLFIVMIRVQCSLISYLNKNFNGHFLYGLKRPTKDVGGIKENQVSF